MTVAPRLVDPVRWPLAPVLVKPRLLVVGLARGDLAPPVAAPRIPRITAHFERRPRRHRRVEHLEFDRRLLGTFDQAAEDRFPFTLMSELMEQREDVGVGTMLRIKPASMSEKPAEAAGDCQEFRVRAGG